MTEAAVERPFSRHKIEHTRLRANLNTENLETQLFIRHNFERILKIASKESKSEDVEGEILTWLCLLTLIEFIFYVFVFFSENAGSRLVPANGLLDPISS